LIIIISLGILAVITIIAIIVMLDPLRRSKEKIRESILEYIPIGTTLSDAVKIIEDNRKWTLEYVNNDSGYIISNGIPYEYGSIITSDDDVVIANAIGDKAAIVNIGNYKSPYRIDVMVFFGFDENKKLIEVSVRKDK
jgi:hypothetical protein